MVRQSDGTLRTDDRIEPRDILCICASLDNDRRIVRPRSREIVRGVARLVAADLVATAASVTLCVWLAGVLGDGMTAPALAAVLLAVVIPVMTVGAARDARPPKRGLCEADDDYRQFKSLHRATLTVWTSLAATAAAAAVLVAGYLWNAHVWDSVVGPVTMFSGGVQLFILGASALFCWEDIYEIGLRRLGQATRWGWVAMGAVGLALIWSIAGAALWFVLLGLPAGAVGALPLAYRAVALSIIGAVQTYLTVIYPCWAEKETERTDPPSMYDTTFGDSAGVLLLLGGLAWLSMMLWAVIAFSDGRLPLLFYLAGCPLGLLLVCGHNRLIERTRFARRP